MSAPIRGTQSFVAVMSRVWSRPSLTGLEIAWRWLPLLLVEGFLEIVEHMLGIGVYVPANTWSAIHGFQSISIFQPAAAVEIIGVAVGSLFPHSLTESRGFIIPLLLWNLIAALGRTIVLRRLDPTLHARRLALFLLGTLRTLFLSAAWALWIWLVIAASRIAITAPAARGEEPSLVLFAAMLIVGTLALYCLWAIVSWPLQLAPLLAMRNNLGAFATLRAAVTSAKVVRAKLIEINLVMNIVKLVLIVLAMVFSASPLPFTSVATPEFLHLWWAGVILLYLGLSDYFHVVRAAAYLSLHRALTPTP